MSEREWPEGKETEETTPPESGSPTAEPEKTAGGADPATGERGAAESSNADIPAAG